MSLEDLYNGKVSKLAVQRNVICGECKGKGGKDVCRLELSEVEWRCTHLSKCPSVFCAHVHVYVVVVYTCTCTCIHYVHAVFHVYTCHMYVLYAGSCEALWCV